MKTYLSGITPSSAKGLHLGNYFGAVKPHVEFQQTGKCNYFVANIHALNTVFSKKEVEQNTQNIYIEYLAFGIDPDNTNFFVQSDIEAIPYIQTILNNAVTVAELMRMHAYKDKLQNDTDQENINFGLFSYPVLMAADILAFAPDMVPVGEDQTQHVEICREIARTFNNRYGNVLKIPELYIKKESARVKGIDGIRKMSKSLGNDIPVFGTEEEVRKQIMKITTDPNRIHADDPGDPDKNVTFEYLELLDFDTHELGQMKEKYKAGTIKDVEIKDRLIETFFSYFKQFRDKKQELLQNLDYVNQIRAEGAARAGQIANETLGKMRKAVGLEKPTFVPNPKPQIQYEDFAKLDLRIGTIKSAEPHPNADKLLKLIIDLGTEERQILAGIAAFKKPEELVGKQIPIVFNLAPREMRGLVSQGMIMAADDGEGIALLHPEKLIKNGSVVR